MRPFGPRPTRGRLRRGGALLRCRAAAPAVRLRQVLRGPPVASNCRSWRLPPEHAPASPRPRRHGGARERTVLTAAAALSVRLPVRVATLLPLVADHATQDRLHGDHLLLLCRQGVWAAARRRSRGRSGQRRAGTGTSQPLASVLIQLLSAWRRAGVLRCKPRRRVTFECMDHFKPETPDAQVAAPDSGRCVFAFAVGVMVHFSTASASTWRASRTTIRTWRPAALGLAAPSSRRRSPAARYS